MEYFRYLARLLVLFTAMPVHEFAHGYVADRLGDPTARSQGRLTLSPFAHLDLLGGLMIVFFGFGYAKPVPVNPRNFQKPRAGMAITAAAGPVSNLLMAFVLMIAYKVYVYAAFAAGNGGDFFPLIFSVMISTNISLACFNLLPIFPLDGSRILAFFLPGRYLYKMEQYGQIISIVLLCLVMFTDLITYPLGILSGWIWDGMVFLTGFVDHLMQAVLF